MIKKINNFVVIRFLFIVYRSKFKIYVNSHLPEKAA